jgi:hypothetical protein
VEEGRCTEREHGFGTDFFFGVGIIDDYWFCSLFNNESLCVGIVPSFCHSGNAFVAKRHCTDKNVLDGIVVFFLICSANRQSLSLAHWFSLLLTAVRLLCMQPP